MITLSLLFYCSLFSVCENARVKSSAFVCACVVSCLSVKCFVNCGVLKENQSRNEKKATDIALKTYTSGDATE